jgi:MFS family permease
MAATDIGAATGLSDVNRRSQLRRAVIASTIGTTIEWYDFLLYSIVTGLVFAKLYFPAADPLVATMQAYAIFFVGFIARPVGAFIFGHYGDRIGRKAALIATLLLTGLATFAVALVPSYEQIGILGRHHHDPAAFRPRRRGRRRMGRLGIAVDGMGTNEPMRIAALSLLGPNSVRPPACSWRTSQYCSSAGFPATSS